MHFMSISHRFPCQRGASAFAAAAEAFLIADAQTGTFEERNRKKL
jgi:hypothetical protein